MRFEILKNDVRKILAMLPASIKKHILEDALEPTAECIADKARTLAPEDTGALKASIDWTTVNADLLVVTVQVTALNKQGRPYPLFQEYGWITVNGRKIEGKWYLHRAFLLCLRKGNSAIRRAIKAGIKELTPYGVHLVDDADIFQDGRQGIETTETRFP